MLIKSIRCQMKIMFEKKNFIIMFFSVFTYVLINYFYNVNCYHGLDVVDMYNPMELLLLASNTPFFYFFMMFYPIIVVIPTAFSYVQDKDVGEHVFLQSRFGTVNYYVGKMIAAFSVTFITFALPLLIEIVLNMIAFPIDATATIGYYVYDEIMLDGVNDMFFSQLFCYSPYVYSVAYILYFGIVSGILSCFILGLSMLFNPKIKIFMLAPLYLMEHFFSTVMSMVGTENRGTVFAYFRMYDMFEKSVGVYMIVLGVLLTVVLLCVVVAARTDKG